MATNLFAPATLRALELQNKIVVAPMCQYSAVEGSMTDWHLMHLGQFAVSGYGLVFVEATGVEAQGRITPGCTGLYSDENERSMEKVIQFYRDFGSAKLGIQLAHAGRKASVDVPWNGGAPLLDDPRAWQTSGPSAVPYDTSWHTPTELDSDGMDRVRNAFKQAAERSVRLGFDVVEVHAAHGYLLHQFMSPLSNRRDDQYGGPLENRLRFPLEIFEIVRSVVPESVPVGIRISATDWVEDSWDLDDAVILAEELLKRGCDFMDVSSGGNSPEQKIKVGPGYQASFSAGIKQRTGMTTMAVGKITEPIQAETILATGQADFVALARGALYDPRWPWHAAEVLGESAAFPSQYQRCHPSLIGLPVPGNPPTAK